MLLPEHSDSRSSFACSGVLSRILTDISPAASQAGITEGEQYGYNTYLDSLRLGLLRRLHDACALLDFYYGDSFAALPAVKRRRVVYDVSEIEELERREEVRQGRYPKGFLDKRLERAYLQFQSNGLDRSWERFVGLYRKINHPSLSDVVGDSAMPFLIVLEHMCVELPHGYLRMHTSGGESINHPEDMMRNTGIQLEIARGLGILNDEESWIDFINRDAIEPVNPVAGSLANSLAEMKRYVKAKPGVIPGLIDAPTPIFSGKSLESFKGTPWLYYPIPTNYSQVFAKIELSHSKKFGYMDFDYLLARGMSTPRISVIVPSENLLQAA